MARRSRARRPDARLLRTPGRRQDERPLLRLDPRRGQRAGSLPRRRLHRCRARVSRALRLWHRLLWRSASEPGRSCHGDGPDGQGDRRRRSFVLPCMKPAGRVKGSSGPTPCSCRKSCGRLFVRAVPVEQKRRQGGGGGGTENGGPSTSCEVALHRGGPAARLALRRGRVPQRRDGQPAARGMELSFARLTDDGVPERVNDQRS